MSTDQKEEVHQQLIDDHDKIRSNNSSIRSSEHRHVPWTEKIGSRNLNSSVSVLYTNSNISVLLVMDYVEVFSVKEYG